MGEQLPKEIEPKLRELIFRTFGHQRYTQDSPILPDVWLAFARTSPLDETISEDKQRCDVILTPRSGDKPSSIASTLLNRLKRYNSDVKLDRPIEEYACVAVNMSSVVARLRFDELICVVLPMTHWWRTLSTKYTDPQDIRAHLAGLVAREKEVSQVIQTNETWEYYRFVLLAGFIAVWRQLSVRSARSTADALMSEDTQFDELEPVLEAFLDIVQWLEPGRAPNGSDAEIWNINVNRPTTAALYESRAAIKADAAQNLFSISTKNLAWAVVDCGIDATHPAFADRSNMANAVPPGTVRPPIDPRNSRIVATYDFTYLRELLAGRTQGLKLSTGDPAVLSVKQQKEMRSLRRRVLLGREVDWEVILPIIGVSHDPVSYVPPAKEHGTHVAGILAGNWPADENPTTDALIGVCPDLRLYDIRVFDRYGNADEFTIMAALQVIAHLNRDRDNPVIHGVNLSLSLKHEVISYACGRTPICDECGSLVGKGTVVVAAAGNQGFEASLERGGPFGAYRGVSITDPGNADAVITVGSTHRSLPHMYGVSYFSSRGPTGDGRRKPDLVAPGEKITSVVPGPGSKRMDGTSMAAPHVSGAAALLMARHRHLVGRPDRIKEVLTKSATDLGRDRDFQGAGMLDILRALQCE